MRPEAVMSMADSGHVKLAYGKARKYFPVFVLAALTGVMGGTIGGVFHLSVDRVFDLRTFLAQTAERLYDLGWLASMSFSAVMTLAAVGLVRRFAPEASGSGVQEIEGALSGVRPLRWKRVLPVKFIGGVLSIGGGMVLGREGPTIQMGAGGGRMLCELFHLDDPQVRHSLVAAGAGAGLAAAFNAPLAGILFIVEEMRRQFRFNFVSFHCVVIASAASDIMVRLICGPAQDIPMRLFPMPALSSLLLFLFFGCCIGVIGFFFNYLLVATLDICARIEAKTIVPMSLTLGAIIGLLLWFFPDAAGGGHRALLRALGGGTAVELLALAFVLRLATTFFSYGSGAPGGIFAPMLALGTLFGLVFGNFGHEYFPGLIEHPDMFAVAGMGALFAATVRAPVTGLVLVMEMTLNYSLTLPLIVTCMSSAITAEILGGRPIYTVLLERALNLSQGTSQETVLEQADSLHEENPSSENNPPI